MPLWTLVFKFICGHVFIFLGYKPWGGIAEAYGIHLTFWRLVFWKWLLFYISISSACRSQFVYILLSTDYCLSCLFWPSLWVLSGTSLCFWLDVEHFHVFIGHLHVFGLLYLIIITSSQLRKLSSFPFQVPYQIFDVQVLSLILWIVFWLFWWHLLKHRSFWFWWSSFVAILSYLLIRSLV